MKKKAMTVYNDMDFQGYAMINVMCPLLSHEYPKLRCKFDDAQSLLVTVNIFYDYGYTDITLTLKRGIRLDNDVVQIFLANGVDIDFIYINHDNNVNDQQVDDEDKDYMQAACIDNDVSYEVVEKKDDTDLSANEELREDVVKYLSEIYDFCDDEEKFIKEVSDDCYIIKFICCEFDLKDCALNRNVILSARDEFVRSVNDDSESTC